MKFKLKKPVIIILFIFKVISCLCQNGIVVTTDCGIIQKQGDIDLCGFSRNLEIKNKKLNSSTKLLEVPFELINLERVENLKVFNMSVTFPITEFSFLKNLKTAYFDHCNIKNESLCPFMSDSLTSLYIVDCNLKSIPLNCRNLLTLYVHNNKKLNYDTLFEILKSTSVMSISLGYKNLKSIPRSIGNLQKLEYLRISKCNDLNYKTLIKETFNLKNLKRIEFVNCKINKRMISELGMIPVNIDLNFINCYGNVKLINNLKYKLKNRNNINVDSDYHFLQW